MTVPTSVLVFMAVIGLISTCTALLWGATKLWYMINKGSLPPSAHDLNLQHQKYIHSLQEQHLELQVSRLSREVDHLRTENKEMVERLTSMISQH